MNGMESISAKGPIMCSKDVLRSAKLRLYKASCHKREQKGGKTGLWNVYGRKIKQKGKKQGQIKNRVSLQKVP